MVGSGQHLLGLINDILDISKIEAGAFKLFVEADADLNPELKAVVATAETLLKDKPVEIINRVDGNLPGITGDKRRISQIMLNLVSNAAKFTDKGSITITAAVQDDNILLSVEDTGPGIPLADQQAVFEAFRQSDSGLRVGAGDDARRPQIHADGAEQSDRQRRQVLAAGHRHHHRGRGARDRADRPA